VGTKFNPYLHFRDTTRAAMEFYQSIFGGELTFSTYAEYHASEDPAEADKIMHSVLEAPNVSLMASDTPNQMEFTPGTNTSLSLSGDNEDELSGYYQRLADGGTVTMPLAKAPWGDTFGSCVDKFGTSWLVNITPAT
jgi:PhnB protein